MSESYLSDMSGNRFQGGASDPIGKFFAISQDCQFCGKKESTGRSLVWIIGECIDKKEAIFPCQNCGKYLKIPSEIFTDKCLERLKNRRHAIYQEITVMNQFELLVQNWSQILLDANKSGSVDIESMKWDGTGSCPGCGKASVMELSQRLECVWCHSEMWVNQNKISKNSNTNLLCHRCNRSMVIPPSVWCPVCGHNIRDETVFIRLFREANK